MDCFVRNEEKYLSRLSIKKPIIIRLDGVNVCGNKSIDLISEETGSFNHSLRETSRIISDRYKCTTISIMDEISIVIDKPIVLLNKFKKLEGQNASSRMSQEVFQIFNSLYKGEELQYFCTKSFSLSQHSKSYLKHRASLGYNAFIIQVSKEYIEHSQRDNLSLQELIDLLEKEYDFNSDKLSDSFISGYICQGGKRVNIDLSSNLKKYYIENNKIANIDDIIETPLDSYDSLLD